MAMMLGGQLPPVQCATNKIKDLAAVAAPKRIIETY